MYSQNRQYLKKIFGSEKRMNEKYAGLKSNLATVDAHIITPEEYEEIPELPPAFFAEGTRYRNGKPVQRDGQQKPSTGIPAAKALLPV